MDGSRILVVDDEPDMVDNLTRLLRRAGYRVLHATEAERALALVDAERPDLVLTDLRMPGMDGMTLMRRAHEIDPSLPVIMITAFATIDSAVTAIKQGAFDYLPKPFTMDHLLVVVERALRQRTLTLENRNLRQQLHETLVLDNVVGRSAAMGRVFDLVLRAARSDANILVTGESGTGKELIARAIHARSPRASAPFVPVDCAAIPENLLESELFGHEKGAFTGAIRTKPGLMEVASGGTLFLDEIAELPVLLQSKLLRALQERRFRRVGGTAEMEADVRLVCATNRALRAEIARGRFREDLYYRVAVIDIPLPPLCERAGDVRLLAHTFLKRFGRGTVTHFSEDALAALERYRWPGNVRELQNVIERACALAEGHTVELADLPEHVIEGEEVGPHPGSAGGGHGLDRERRAAGRLSLREAKEEWVGALESTYLRQLLERHGGNISAAAREAGVDRKTFHRLVKKHGIERTHDLGDDRDARAS
jgi:two-component system, NtrC family, response regulator AtoC